MALLIKMETEVKVKATAEQFYHVFKTTQPHHLPNICKDVDAEILDGEWHAHGSTRSWTHNPEGGKPEKFKEKVEYDDKNMKVTHVGMEGDVFTHYKSFKAIFEFVPKPGGEAAVVKVAIEYEKVSKDVPSPDNHLEIMVGFTKDIDAHLSKA